MILSIYFAKKSKLDGSYKTVMTLLDQYVS